MQEDMQNFPPIKSPTLKHLCYMVFLPQTDKSDTVLNTYPENEIFLKNLAMK